MAEFTQTSPSVIEQVDSTKSASNLGGPEATKLVLPDYSSILSTILGDDDAKVQEDKRVEEGDPMILENAETSTKTGPDVKDVKSNSSKNDTGYKPVLNQILHPEPPKTGGSFESWKAYIIKGAQNRGIDPQIALRVAEHEGLQKGTWQSNYKRGGYREPSYGPYQLLKGGPGTGFTTGLGNEFQKQTGLDPSDPKNATQGIDFALDYAKKNGWSAWYGAKAAGVSRWQGISQG